MPLTIELALQQMEPILAELDNEHLDALISALAKRITAPQKKITILWGEQPEEPYEPYEYEFTTTLEYDAYQQCLTDHDGYLGARTDDDANLFMFLTEEARLHEMDRDDEERMLMEMAHYVDEGYSDDLGWEYQ
jgi:hypothetical protein